LLAQLKGILVPRHQDCFAAVETAINELTCAKGELQSAYDAAVKALDKLDTSVTESREDASLMTRLGELLLEYVAQTRSFAHTVSKNVTATTEADRVLALELDSLAGTEDISVLLDLLERRRDIEKKLEIDCILDGLKDLRKTVEQYAAQTMLNAISGELTSQVMEWYGQIRTTGDPDVHFAGFDMERTAKGELRARRVKIMASSYGKDLVSAVSSLSESKLNALGLCVSIATNLKAGSPFDFIIIDDPIQSWDAEHETQFVQVVRKLVERGKQLIILSHNKKWMEQVRTGCRTLNGRFYEITGYTQAGPHIFEMPWEKWTQRLREVDAILKDPSADSVRLQQAEEEVRIVVCDLTALLYHKRRGVSKSPHDLNSAQVRKILVECGVDTDLVDRIALTFETTDDAHHAPLDYTAQRSRIRQYHSWAHELGHLLA
jgi:hypothetical protein